MRRIGADFVRGVPPQPPRRSLDDGSAALEFVTASLLLLVPTVYLLVAVAHVQAAAFAVEAAARGAARAAASADTSDQARARAETVTHWSLVDHGLDVPATDTLTLACSAPDCVAPSTVISARVRVVVGLPGAPTAVSAGIPVRVPISATHVHVVDELRGPPT